MTRVRWVSLLGVIAAATAATSVAVAQTYPVKPVKFLVPFAPGGATDIAARMLGHKLGELWGQTVIIENRGGAAGNIAAAEMAKAAPDGYTLFFTSGSVVTANEHVYPNIAFNPDRDFVPITNVVRGPQVIVVPAGSPHRNLKDLIAAAQREPRGMNFGHAGVGSQTHLAAENFLYAARIDMQHVPYKGEGPALTDLVAGQTAMATPNLSAAISFINSGKLRALAVTGRERAPQLADVPTVAETIPGFENYGWFGLMAAAGTPKAILDKVHGDAARVLDSAEMRGRFYVLGMSIVANAPEQFARDIRNERARWGKVVVERRIKPN